MNKIILCIKQINSFEGSLFVYSLSYALLLTIAPALIVFVATFQWFQMNIDGIIEMLSLFVPNDVLLPFVEFLLNKSDTSLWMSMVTMVLSLFLSSRCIYSFLLIASRTEEIEYPKWSLRIYSIYEFILIYMYLLICILVNSIFFERVVWFSSFLYFGASLLGFYLFYHLCTFKKRESMYGLLGALFSTISIYLVGLVFFQIIQSFTNYDNIYGPLASFMILSLSVFVVSTIIYTGYILNNVFQQDKNEKYRKNTFFHLCAKIEKMIIERNKDESRN